MMGFLAQTTQPAITGLDVVKEVSDFFYLAWLMLLAMAGAITLVAGWLVPWWISRAQKRDFANREATLSAEIQSATAAAVKKIEALEADLLERIDREVGGLGSMLFHILCGLNLADEMWGTSTILGIYAAWYEVKAGSQDAAAKTLSWLLEEVEPHAEQAGRAGLDKHVKELESAIRTKGWEDTLAEPMGRLRKLMQETEEH